MSSSITDPKTSDSTQNVESPKDKGKSKAKADESMEEEEEEEEEDEEEGEEEEGEEEEEEEMFEEIDPSVIIGGRRTRGVKVDYSSKEAHAKAGLKVEEDEHDSEDDVEMKD